MNNGKTIKDGGQIMDIVKALQEILEADDEVRGDPGKFQDHLSFLSMMNEKKHWLGETFTQANEYLARFPVGTVILMGPATSDMWWPDTKGSAANQKWQQLSGEYFALLTKGNIHPWIRGTAPLSELGLGLVFLQSVTPGLTITLKILGRTVLR